MKIIKNKYAIKRFQTNVISKKKTKMSLQDQLTCNVSFGGKGAWIAPKSNASGFTQRATEDMLQTGIKPKQEMMLNSDRKRIRRNFLYGFLLQNIAFLPPFSFHERSDFWDSVKLLPMIPRADEVFPWQRSSAILVQRGPDRKKSNLVAIKTFQNDCQLRRIF